MNDNLIWVGFGIGWLAGWICAVLVYDDVRHELIIELQEAYKAVVERIRKVNHVQ